MKKMAVASCIAASCLLLSSSCKKEKKTEESQGTNFNLLLKTITTYSNSDRKTTVLFTYNASRQLIEQKTTDISQSAGNSIQTEIFYRNASGRLDSAVYMSASSGINNYKAQTYYNYDGTGKLILSVQNVSLVTQPYKDSSLYIYSGNTLQQRLDYRRFGAAAYSLLRDAAYQFDVTGNLTRTIFQWTTHPGLDTASFQYDNKVNALPVDRLVFYWAPLFYNDYKPANNLKQATNAKLDYPSYDYEYQYSGNNKPLYRKTKVAGGPEFYETLYYYD